MARCNGPRAFPDASEMLLPRPRAPLVRHAHHVGPHRLPYRHPWVQARVRGGGVRGGVRTGRGTVAKSRVETYLPSPSPLGQAAPRQSSRGERRRPERRARRRRARWCGSWLRRGAVSPPHCLSGLEQPTHVSPPHQARARLLAGRGVRRSDRPLDEAVRVRLHGAVRADLAASVWGNVIMCFARRRVRGWL